MKDAVLWDVTRCASCKNRRFGETYRSVRQLLVMANFPSSPIPVTQMMDVLSCSETSVLTRAMRLNNPENGILQNNSTALYNYTSIFQSVISYLIEIFDPSYFLGRRRCIYTRT
jgi:hypothetical protein